MSDKQSIYSSQIESRSLSPAHQGSYVRQVLAQVRVSQFLPAEQNSGQAAGKSDHLLRPQDPLATVIERLGTSPHAALPVVDEDRRLIGIVTLDEVYLASQSPSLQALVLAADLMRGDVLPLTPEDTLDRALELFVENDLMTVPVVTNLTDRCLLGMVSRFDISSALSAARPRSRRPVGPACRAGPFRAKPIERIELKPDAPASGASSPLAARWALMGGAETSQCLPAEGTY